MIIVTLAYVVVKNVEDKFAAPLPLCEEREKEGEVLTTVERIQHS
jgi:hypothetical protein